MILMGYIKHEQSVGGHLLLVVVIGVYTVSYNIIIVYLNAINCGIVVV